MAWEYSGNPADSYKDAVRFLIGDTDSEEPLVQDEEIEWALSQNSDVYSAAADVAQSLSAHFATLAQEVKIGPISEKYSNRAADYQAMVLRLEKKANSKGSIDVVNGSADTTTTTPLSVGMHDFTGTSDDAEA